MRYTTLTERKPRTDSTGEKSGHAKLRGLTKNTTAAKPTYPLSMSAPTTTVSIVFAARRVATPAVTPW